MAEAVLLENGSVFPGVRRGDRNAYPVAEAVFNTSMCGYQEILTDPSYAGQIVTMTYPLIGNYGVNKGDLESKKIQCSGFIVRELSEIHSNFTSEDSLEKYLQDENIACMSEVDTRALTRVLRDEGAMRCTFLADGESVEKGLARIKEFKYDEIDFSKEVCNQQNLADYSKLDDSSPLVAVLDFGIKSNILRLMAEFCRFEIFDLEAFSKEENKDRFDGFFLSNGPGDPAAVDGAPEVIRGILERNKPVFGICLGHQLLSLALGGKTYKLKFGHHGANHPVQNHDNGEVEITSQNHGYAVDPESFPGDDVIASHTNLNDGSLSGLKLKDKPVYSIQYHPEASPGPHDSQYLFKQFKEALTSQN